MELNNACRLQAVTSSTLSNLVRISVEWMKGDPFIRWNQKSITTE